MRGHGAKDIGQQGLLRSRLDMQLDMNHRLVRLSRLIDWDRLDTEVREPLNKSLHLPNLS